MKTVLLPIALAFGLAFTVGGSIAAAQPAAVPIAGATRTIGVTITETSQLAMGWSVKRGILGKTVYDDAGNKIGSMRDLIITPGDNVSFVIIGAGGFIGMGSHDVAVPISQIHDENGRIVMSGATKASIKAMPGFHYASDTAQRQQFIANADKDIASAKVEISAFEKKATAAEGDTKVNLKQKNAALQVDVKSAEQKLGSMKTAGVSHWREFEADVDSAMARLRKSLDGMTV